MVAADVEELHADMAEIEPSEEVQDGRKLRGIRSREAIVDALLAIVSEGVLQPTAEQVAERAGLQVRTVFRHFADVASLHAQLSERLRVQAMPLFEKVAGETNQERVRELARTRVQVFEIIGPFKRAADIQRWTQESFRKDHENLVNLLRDGLRRTFPAVGPDTLGDLELVLSFETFERLRHDQGLGVDGARAAMSRMALAVLGSA